MTDLMSGRETLDDVQMIVFCGGFSNSDVLGSAKGWASGFKWNEKARTKPRTLLRAPDTPEPGYMQRLPALIDLGLYQEQQCQIKMETQPLAQVRI